MECNMVMDALARFLSLQPETLNMWLDAPVPVVGWLAGWLKIICVLPQTWKIIKTKQVGSVSLTMVIMLAISDILWMYYAARLHLTPVLVTNLLALLCCVSTMICYFMYRDKTVE